MANRRSRQPRAHSTLTAAPSKPEAGCHLMIKWMLSTWIIIVTYCSALTGALLRKTRKLSLPLSAESIFFLPSYPSLRQRWDEHKYHQLPHDEEGVIRPSSRRQFSASTSRAISALLRAAWSIIQDIHKPYAQDLLSRLTRLQEFIKACPDRQDQILQNGRLTRQRLLRQPRTEW